MISYKPRLAKEAWLVLPSKDALKAMPIKKIREKMWQTKALAFVQTQQATKLIAFKLITLPNQLIGNIYIRVLQTPLLRFLVLRRH